MNTLWIVLIAAIVIYTAYNYARRIDRNVIRSDAKRATPAKMYMDGVDFMPTSKNVLYGYHFKSIAAAGPIVGPIIAANIWGWFPSLLWLVIGVTPRRLGQRLLGDHGGRPERRQQPLRHLAQADRAADAADPLRLHLLLPDAPRRRLRRHPRGDPLGAARRPVRHRHAGAHGAPRGPDDVPLEDGPRPRDGRDRRGDDPRDGARPVGPDEEREGRARPGSRRRSDRLAERRRSTTCRASSRSCRSSIRRTPTRASRSPGRTASGRRPPCTTRRPGRSRRSRTTSSGCSSSSSSPTAARTCPSGGSPSRSTTSASGSCSSRSSSRRSACSSRRSPARSTRPARRSARSRWRRSRTSASRRRWPARPGSRSGPCSS